MSSLILKNDIGRIEIDPTSMTGGVYKKTGHSEVLMADIRYLLCVRDNDYEFRLIDSQKKCLQDDESLEFSFESHGLFRAILSITAKKNSEEFLTSLSVTSVSNKPFKLGLNAFCLDKVGDSIRVRFFPINYGGWMVGDCSLACFPVTENGKQTEVGMAVDYIRIDPMDMRTKKQGLALNLPSCLLGGKMDMRPGETVHGEMAVELLNQDIWDPELLDISEEYAKSPGGILPPRHQYSTHISRWESLITNDKFWVNLGQDMGMFHRGFYGMIRFGEPRISGILGYKGFQCTGTENDRLIELSWGGSSNALQVYTLFRYGSAWATEKATQIMNATLHVYGKGYQVLDGPCKYAWYNGLLPNKKQFIDRYGRQTIYTPDQGIANYFLAKSVLEGFYDKGPVAEAIEQNCHYLRTLGNGFGGLKMAQKTDGSPGVDRYECPYDGNKSDLAMPTAMGALSFLMHYRLTQNEQSLYDGKQLLNHLIGKVETNDWRVHEYDSWGWGSPATSWILTTLCEWYQSEPTKELKAAIDRTFKSLLGWRQRYDLELWRYSDNEKCWGGELITRGGLTSLTSNGLAQGGDSLHNRFDPALAFWTHYQTFKDAESYSALVEFLNNLTYHQWNRNDIEFGVGPITEAVHLSDGHIQDTAQVLHSNCLFHILLNKSLFIQSCNTDLATVSFQANELLFEVKILPEELLELSLDGQGCESVIIKQHNKVVFCGNGRKIVINNPIQGQYSVSVN